jgi:phage gp46-like protein
MTFDRFQGDPRLSLEDDGSTITVKGGQPVMDQGLENVVLIDLFTKEGWWGNYLFRDTSQQIGSTFEDTAREAGTLAGLNNAEAAAKGALNHMVAEGLAKEDALVRAQNPTGGRLDMGIIVQPPGRDFLALLATKHGSNWIAQKENPAYERLTNGG